MGACGLDAVVRTLFEESPGTGPSTTDRADEQEDRDELLHEVRTITLTHRQTDEREEADGQREARIAGALLEPRLTPEGWT